MRTWPILLLLLTACPKNTPPEVATPDPALADLPPVRIDSGAGLAEHTGRRVTLVGDLSARALPDGTTEGIAVVLAGDVPVFVAEGAPPESWAWMVGSQVRMQGILAAKSPSGLPVAWLADAEAPMPAEAEMPSLGFP